MNRPYHSDSIKASYSGYILDSRTLSQIVTEITRKLSRRRDQFDVIAVRGMSGSIVGGAVAVRLQKNLLIVRKKGESPNTLRTVEGDYSAKKYIIIDDMICTGDTINIIRNEIRDSFNYDNKTPPEHVGIILYQDGCSFGNEIERAVFKRWAGDWGCWIDSSYGKNTIIRP